MRRIFIAMIAGGLLLLSGVAASAKPDTSVRVEGQNGQQQQQTQTQKDQKATQPAARPATKPATAPATKPATKPATASPTTCTAQAEQTGEWQGEHQDADCNGQQDQSGANDSKTEVTDQAAANGNNED